MSGQHGKRVIWLGLTPEPERELPEAVAALRALDSGTRQDTGSEVRRIRHLILHGTQRTWLRYLADVTALVQRVSAHPHAAPTTRTALNAAETVLDHHRMLIGLPGSAYDRVAAERDTLTGIVGVLRERLAHA
jgi:hypothetical protein